MLIFLSLPLVVIISLDVGSFDIDILDSAWNIYAFFMHNTELDSQSSVLLDARIPRILLAIFVGASLAGSGAVMQNIFKNPLIDPFLLGISSGAALGCALSIGIFPQINLSLLAFLGAFLSSIFILCIGRIKNNLSLVLIGIVISAFLGAFSSFIQFIATPEQSQAITIWLLGSLSLASWSDVAKISFGFFIAFIPLYLLRYKINILSLDNDEAISLGVNVWRIKIICMFFISLVCSICVSASGTIGWIGLVVPHIARFLVGSNMVNLLPASLMLGASFLVLGDCVARGVSMFDLPLGSINAVIFAPIFLILCFRYMRG